MSETVLAVVAVSNVAPAGEFRLRAEYLRQTDDEMLAHARSVLTQRLLRGNVINFFGVQWGLMSHFVSPDPHYVPAGRAAESLFLNLYTEKQWTTNCGMLQRQLTDPIGTGVANASLWAEAQYRTTPFPVWCVHCLSVECFWKKKGRRGVPIVEFRELVRVGAFV